MATWAICGAVILLLAFSNGADGAHSRVAQRRDEAAGDDDELSPRRLLMKTETILIDDSSEEDQQELDLPKKTGNNLPEWVNFYAESKESKRKYREQPRHQESQEQETGGRGDRAVWATREHTSSGHTGHSEGSRHHHSEHEGSDQDYSKYARSSRGHHEQSEGTHEDNDGTDGSHEDSDDTEGSHEDSDETEGSHEDSDETEGSHEHSQHSPVESSEEHGRNASSRQESEMEDDERIGVLESFNDISTDNEILPGLGTGMNQLDLDQVADDLNVHVLEGVVQFKVNSKPWRSKVLRTQILPDGRSVLLHISVEHPMFLPIMKFAGRQDIVTTMCP